MAVGLDIGSKTIKVVETVSQGGKIMLKAAGIVGITAGSLEHTQDEKAFEGIAAAIKKLFADAKVTSKNVSIALPENQVFTRSIRFPSLTDQEIASAVKWEAEEYIPFPIKEAIIQHQILERRDNTTPPEVLVLLVATPRNLVQKYIKILSMAGLTVVGVETELLALVRALAPANQTCMIIDFGSSSTDIAIARNTQLVFSRSIQTAGEAFTRAVAQSLGVQTNQAEEYKRAYGLTTHQLEGKVGTAITPVFKIVSEEIKKALHFYQTEEKGETPTSIILSGGTAGLPDAAPTLTKLLGIEVAIANPFFKVTLDQNSSRALAPYAPLYSVAVGLAEREG